MDSKIKISKLNSFQKLFEKLLHKAKSDRSDSIKIESQNTLRAIVWALSPSQYESEMFSILDNLQQAQIDQLKTYVDLEDKLRRQKDEMQPILEQ